jgi:hypothetical protein
MLTDGRSVPQCPATSRKVVTTAPVKLDHYLSVVEFIVEKTVVPVIAVRAMVGKPSTMLRRSTDERGLHRWLRSPC